MQTESGKKCHIRKRHIKTTNQNRKRKTQGSLNKKSLLKIGVLVGLLVIASLFYKDSFEEIIEGIKNLSLKQIIISNLFATGFFLAEGMIIHVMAHPFQSAYRWYKGIKTAYLCEFYRLLTLGNGSGFAAIYYLQQDGVGIAKGTGITTLQFIIKKIAVMLFGVGGYCYLLQSTARTKMLTYQNAMLAGIAITFVVAIAMTMAAFSVRVKNWILIGLHALEKRFPKYQDKMTTWEEQLELLNSTGQLLFQQKKNAVIILALNLLKLFCIFLVPAYLLIGQSSSSFIDYIMVMAVAYMLAGVIPAPSGIGSLEFTFLLFFSSFAEEGVLIPAIMVFRLVTWIVPFAIGALIFWIDGLRRKRQ